MKKTFLIAFTLITLQGFADSPLTSTFFAMSYNDVPIIGAVMQRRMSEGIYNLPLTAEQLTFLDNNSVSLDQKIALINGLGWGETANTEVYIQHLMQKYSLSHDVLDSALVLRDPELVGLWPAARTISSNDLIILSYLQVMGDYFQPLKGWNCALYAMENNPGSEASSYVGGLIAAQVYLDVDWCSVYVVMAEVMDAPYDKDFMRPSAVESIMEYISLYEASCQEEEPTAYIPEIKYEWTAEYWASNPCYPKPATKQISTSTSTVDLELLNDATGEQAMYMNWINYNNSIDGTSILLTIRNNGTATSIPTNVALIIAGSETSNQMIIQGQIPAINGGSTVNVQLEIVGYWIYNPDALFDVKIDYDENIEESNEENNYKWFFEQG